MNTIQPLKPTVGAYGELRLKIEKLVAYSADRIEKFHRDQKWATGLGGLIMGKLDAAVELSYQIAAYDPSYDREHGLRQLAVKLKALNCYIKAAYLRKQITAQNWQAWSTMVTEIDNQVIRMALYLQKKRTNK